MQNCNTHTSNSDDLNYNAFTSSLKKVFHIHSSKCRIICTIYLAMYSPVTLSLRKLITFLIYNKPSFP